MLMNDLVRYIGSQDAAIKLALNQLKPQLADKNISLEERWQAFEAVAQFLPEESYGDGNIDALDDNLTMYDDFYIDRRETTTYPEMYVRILELAEDREYEQEQIDAWREVVLANGYGSFTYDW
jgi:hypothetical protein